jgi:hypothetical protein
LLPKLAFDSLLEEKPYKFIFTSATLPEEDIMHQITGLSF